MTLKNILAAGIYLCLFMPQAVAASSFSSVSGDTNLVLWYRQPAKEWTDALPVGNGRLAAMVFGRTENERIQLNEETFWSGGPYDPSKRGASDSLPEIRRLVFEGKFLEAHNLFG